jgi:capsular polysaccharide transport system permease protein
LDATPPQELLQQPQPDAPPRPSRWRALAARVDRIFLFSVALPTLLAGVYFGVIASDVYISESRFVVRNPQRQTQSTIGALLQSTGFTRSQDDTYSVHDYVLSRDALRELDRELKVRESFTAPAIDVFNRFPGFGWDESFEAFHRYYRKHVSIEYDTVSSITTLYVRAYTAEDAQRFNDLLLKMGERLVNNLNDRSRQDLIQVAEKEVGTAEERAKQAALTLSGYRNRQLVFDPDRQSALQLQGVAKVQEELLATEAQLAQLRQISPDNPQIPSLRNRVETLKKAIAAESSKVTGGTGSFSAKARDFDRLALEKTFADRQLATALASLESARNEAQRKQLYLERLVQPNLPDMAVEPRRIRSVLMIFVLGLIVWGVASLVVASVKEHTD